MRSIIKFLVILLILIGSIYSSLIAQQVKLKGLVIVFNSKQETGQLKYCSNAEVRAPNSIPQATDVNGYFELTIVEKEKFSSIPISISYPGYEVVNSNDLQEVRLGMKDTFRVFLAPVGYLSQAQLDFYNVSLDYIIAEYDSISNSLKKEGEEAKRAIAELEKLIGDTIANRFEAERILVERLESMKRGLPSFARRLSTINLDFASERIKKAFRNFQSGNLVKAMQILDEEELIVEANETVSTIKALEDSLGRAIHTSTLDLSRLDLLAKSMLLGGFHYAQEKSYSESINLYLNLIGRLESQDTSNKYIPISFWHLSNVYLQNLRPDSSDFYKRASAKAILWHPGNANQEMIFPILDLAVWYSKHETLDTAQIFLDYSIQILHKSILPKQIRESILVNLGKMLAVNCEKRGDRLTLAGMTQKGSEQYLKGYFLSNSRRHRKRLSFKIRRLIR